ncbi:uncharacterized protein SPPG_01136 [Spizellomyces punctatus DAOM BR117]|uniref:Calreticulin n=1 Tax=Spizellomyces punctatus (strain DAOM BR117) TaxID=645134 RepID=A0A0L0HQJ7_SPIPD|nr:uncharacterized protein SPPG_01136 [Spizellomyces punctatus DAOM BR117]KND03666.1 hypothetical protein SPPG_01136 [Spizellomyces punctatus DAOM BR117]|eukprot:XP_016611705.1 hypothetical protein SPPG_01136 [Spizellomyces punctatus DAOM BR117]
MKCLLALASLFVVPVLVRGEIYFKESFDDDSWKKRWVQSTHDSSYGAFNVSTGAFYADAVANRALQTTQDARYYAITAPFDKEFDNKNKTLVIQYTVKFENGANCAGGYLKILPPGINVLGFNGETNYNIMFGPDICGGNTRKVHLIFNYKGENHLVNVDMYPATDQLTHLYTLILHPNQTYQVLVDNEEEHSGSLLEDFNFLPPKRIKDPNVSRPENWDDRETIPDPDDFMPSDWEDEPEEIPDPNDPPPDDWDEEENGEWYQPMVPNPAWKGEWKPRQLPNPAYNGTWVHPEIDNPAYFFDSEIYAYKSAYIAFELWAGYCWFTIRRHYHHGFSGRGEKVCQRNIYEE